LLFIPGFLKDRSLHILVSGQEIAKYNRYILLLLLPDTAGNYQEQHANKQGSSHHAGIGLTIILIAA